jgi:hypothetical protein
MELFTSRTDRVRPNRSYSLIAIMPGGLELLAAGEKFF